MRMIVNGVAGKYLRVFIGPRKSYSSNPACFYINGHAFGGRIPKAIAFFHFGYKSPRRLRRRPPALACDPRGFLPIPTERRPPGVPIAEEEGGVAHHEEGEAASIVHVSSNICNAVAESQGKLGGYCRRVKAWYDASACEACVFAQRHHQNTRRRRQ